MRVGRRGHETGRDLPNLSTGFLGRRVVAHLDARGADVVAPRRAEYDLTVPGAAEAMLADHRPATEQNRLRR